MEVGPGVGYFTEVEALYIELGTSIGAVDIALGYGDDSADAFYADGESGRVTASKALKQPHVQQYMMQCVTEQLGMNATIAASKVMKLATGARSEYVQLEASKDILDRAGFKPIDRSQVQIAGDIRVSIDLG